MGSFKGVEVGMGNEVEVGIGSRVSVGSDISVDRGTSVGDGGTVPVQLAMKKHMKKIVKKRISFFIDYTFP